MINFWENFLLEIALLGVLGIVYYFYQKKKILEYEKNKNLIVMNYILESCLTEKTDHSQPELDKLIESLDDYLEKRIPDPPILLLRNFSNSQDCSEELKNIIFEGIKEIETLHGKK